MTSQADINQKEDAIGAAPLFVAANLGHTEVINELLKRDETEVDIATITDGATPLIIAAAHGHGKAVKALLAKGADPRCTLTTDGTTAGECATAGGYTLLGQALAQACYNIEFDQDPISNDLERFIALERQRDPAGRPLLPGCDLLRSTRARSYCQGYW